MLLDPERVIRWRQSRRRSRRWGTMRQDTPGLF